MKKRCPLCDKGKSLCPDHAMRKFECVYCGKPMEYEGACEKCGYQEDVALGKIEEIDHEAR